MLRTGNEYRESIRDGREIWIDGERVHDMTTHPAFKPIIDVRARMYDMAHETQYQAQLSYQDSETKELNTTFHTPPRTPEDWQEKDAALDAVMKDIGGVVIRVSDESVGEMWSLYDGQEMLNEVDPQFAKNIEQHILRTTREDPFHVSANTDPKGDRSKTPQEQDPDLLLHVVKKPMQGSLCAVQNLKRRRPMPIKLLSNRPLPDGPETKNFRIMRSVLFAIWVLPDSNTFAGVDSPDACRSKIIRWPTVLMKSILCWCLIMF